MVVLRADDGGGVADGGDGVVVRRAADDDDEDGDVDDDDDGDEDATMRPKLTLPPRRTKTLLPVNNIIAYLVRTPHPQSAGTTKSQGPVKNKKTIS